MISITINTRVLQCSGLASPRWSSAATHSRSWQRCGGAGRSRGAWPDAREGRADPDAEPRGTTTRRRAGPVAPPWRWAPDGDVERRRHGAAREEVGPSAAG
jgi:hypothetical protein